MHLNCFLGLALTESTTGVELKDFSDTAHIVQQLDLVISVDTAVAHLAGALNRPTWLLLPQNADFRWLKERSDSPWYPSMRLFRQRQHGDWSGVVNDIRTAFQDLTLLDFGSLANKSSVYPWTLI